MPENENALPWSDPAWLEQAHEWIHTALEQQGIRPAGAIVQAHVRPWSTVMHLEADRGRVYFKACDSFSAFEPGLTQALYHWRPDCIVRVLAVEARQAWMLLADEGVPLRTKINSEADLIHWETLMPLFAGVQIEMIPRRAQLLSLGVADRRLTALPALFERMAADRGAMRLGMEDGLTEAQYARLTALVPRYAEMCRRLASYAIPETLHHDDFHNSNVYVSEGRYAFSDWGESCLAHPFFSIIITLRSLADRLGLPDEVGIAPESLTPELNHLRDLYLQKWNGFASLETLQNEVFPLAWRVGMVNRALSWYLSNQHLDEPTREEYAYTVPAWLGEWLQAM